MGKRSLPALAVLAAVALAACGGAPSVSMKDLRFKPQTLHVKVGDTVSWRNDDSVDHNVTATRGARFHSKAFGHGASYRIKATRTGTIAYVCTLHPGMVGRLVVER